MDSNQSATTARARKTGSALTSQFFTNREGILNDVGAEPTHRLRIVIRRLRLLLSLEVSGVDARKRQHAVRELQWVAHALGPVRDADVFLHELWPKLRTHLGVDPLIAELEATWRTQRHRHTLGARRALRSRRCRNLLSALERLFEPASVQTLRRDQQQSRDDESGAQGACRIAHDAIKRRTKQVRRRHGKIDAEDGATLHRLRIAIRKLRYVTEFFAPCLNPDRAAATLKRLARLQDVLGAMNDIAVAYARVEAALQNRRGAKVTTLRNALTRWRKAQTKRHQRSFHRAWRDYTHGKALR
jgi:triphosphatase